MTADGDGWYTYKIYGFDMVKVLFNNGGDVQIPGRLDPGFDVAGEMWYRNGEWSTERPDEITVYFYKPDNWGTPNIYYYKNDSDTGPAWPGEEMKSEGDNWYSFTITKYDSAKIMFNSGSNQIPAQNQPGLDASGIMWYKDGALSDYSPSIDDAFDRNIGEAYFEDISNEDIALADNGIMYAKNQINLVAKDGVDFQVIENLGDLFNFKIVGYIELTNDYQIKFLQDLTYSELTDIATVLSSNENVSETFVNVAFYTDEDYYPINDTEWLIDEWSVIPEGINWGMEASNFPEAWDYSDRMSSVNIGLIDSGFDESHEDLTFKKVWNNQIDTMKPEEYSHGTHVAGTMAAGFDNGCGITGASINNELYAYAKRNPMGMSTIMQYKYALALLIGNNVRVINISQHTARPSDIISASYGNDFEIEIIENNASIIEKFLYKLLNKGYDFVIVTSAGNLNNDVDGGGILAEYNSYFNAITQPEVKDHIIVVGAYELDEDLLKYADFSNVGSRVDIVAPGVEIYSTIPNNSYACKTGTSMAAPHVAGAAALMYSVNPRLSGAQVKEILSLTSSNDILSDDDYYYCRLNAGEAVKMSIDTEGEYIADNINKGIILGVVKDARNSRVIPKVEIEAKRCYMSSVNQSKIATSTNAFGEYDFELDTGTYDIMFYKEGYFPLVYYGVSIEPNETLYLPEVSLVEKSTLKNCISGTIKNAEDVSFISGTNINIRAGWNNKSGEIKSSITSGDNGTYADILDDGYYTLEVSKEGFITNYANVICKKDSPNQDVILSSSMEAYQYRIVLTWGISPYDLDSHCEGTVDNNYFNISYMDMNYSNGDVNINLDVDDRNSYGPETITISVQNMESFDFRYYVHDFTNRDKSFTESLSLSCASVSLYRGNELLYVYNIPQSKNGTVWNVFKIQNGKITTLNTIT